MAGAGAEVLCTDIDDAAARATAEPLGARWCRLDVPDADAVAACVDDVVGRAGRLDLMFNNAGIIRRADSVDLAPVDLRVVASDAVDQFDQTREGSERVVRIDLPEAPMVCDGDALSLVEACKNLINNAVAYGKPPITVFVRDDGAALNIGVRDRGDGMAEGLWADAGKRFAKRSGVSSTSAGLGLSIVSAVAQAHGGRLTLRRPEAGGFEVFVELPNLPDIEA